MPRCQHSEGILLLWMWDICSGSGIKCRQHLSHCFTAKDLPTQLFPFLKDSFNSEKTVNIFLTPQVFLKPTSHLVLSFSSNACVPFSPIVRLLPRPKPYTAGFVFFPQTVYTESDLQKYQVLLAPRSQNVFHLTCSGIE